MVVASLCEVHVDMHYPSPQLIMIGFVLHKMIQLSQNLWPQFPDSPSPHGKGG